MGKSKQTKDTMKSERTRKLHDAERKELIDRLNNTVAANPRYKGMTVKEVVALLMRANHKVEV